MTSHRGVTLRYELDPLGFPERLRDRLFELSFDDETRDWMDDCFARPHGAVDKVKLAMARQVWSDFDANAMVRAHDMRVFGPAQWEALLTQVGARCGRLLDVGAGDGAVTDVLARPFDHVETTETSKGMAKRLRERSYVCHEVDMVGRFVPGGAPFDVVSLLNVIDRTARPLTLLAQLERVLGPDSLVVLTVPVPLRPHVHVGPRTVDPEERLPVDRKGFEAQVAALADIAFLGSGFEVVAISRVPYLCRGYREAPVLVLDDSVFALRMKS